MEKKCTKKYFFLDKIYAIFIWQFEWTPATCTSAVSSNKFTLDSLFVSFKNELIHTVDIKSTPTFISLSFFRTVVNDDPSAVSYTI